jgi:hypothetical protein
MQKLALIFLLTLSLLLSGCKTFEETRVPSQEIFKQYPNGKSLASFKTFIVVEDPELKTDGLAKWDWDKKLCVIYLKQYPVCLQHEVRHCLEGHFHGSKKNGDDCF